MRSFLCALIAQFYIRMYYKPKTFVFSTKTDLATVILSLFKLLDQREELFSSDTEYSDTEDMCQNAKKKEQHIHSL